jgi:hypothetical protein
LQDAVRVTTQSLFFLDRVYGVRLLSRPTGAHLAVAAAFTITATAAAVRPVGDPDVWWIAAAGRDLLATGHVPTNNAYSFAEPSHPWVMHEWLHGPLYAWGLDRFGPSFFALVAALLGLAAVALVCVSTLGRARHPLGAALLCIVTAIAFGKRFLTARPSSTSLVLLALFVAIAFGRRFGWKHLVAASAVELVWANAHGSFPMGIALLLLRAAIEQESRTRVRVMAAAVVAGTATFVNPYGSALHALVLAYFVGDRGGTFSEIHARIAEFRPIWRDVGGVVGVPEWAGLFIISALTLAALADRRHRLRALFCAGLLGLAISHVRHVEQFGILSAMLLAPYVDDRFEAWMAPPLADSQHPPGLRSAFAVVPCLAIALVLHGAARRARSATEWIDASLGGSDLPGLVADLPQGARTYVPFRAAGFVIWLGSPRAIKILIDSRNDCYGRDALEQGFRLSDHKLLASEAGAILDRWGIDYVLVPLEEPLAALLQGAEGWAAVSQHGGWSAFARADGGSSSAP